MRTSYGPPQVTAYELRPGEPITVWRIVRSDNREDPVFVNSFKSSYELGFPPRNVEQTARVIYLGISMYLDPRAAAGTARRYAKLGDWVAKLELQPGNGFNFAHTGHRLHLTIWGDAVKLSDATVDIGVVRK